MTHHIVAAEAGDTFQIHKSTVWVIPQVGSEKSKRKIRQNHNRLTQHVSMLPQQLAKKKAKIASLAT